MGGHIERLAAAEGRSEVAADDMRKYRRSRAGSYASKFRKTPTISLARHSPPSV